MSRNDEFRKTTYNAAGGSWTEVKASPEDMAEARKNPKIAAAMDRRAAFEDAIKSGDAKKSESLIDNSYEREEHNKKFNPRPKGPHADELEAASKNGGLIFTTQYLDSMGDR